VNPDPELSEVQQLLVKEAAAALAKQLADMPKPVSVPPVTSESGVSAASQDTPEAILPLAVGQVQRQPSEQRQTSVQAGVLPRALGVSCPVSAVVGQQSLTAKTPEQIALAVAGFHPKGVDHGRVPMEVEGVSDAFVPAAKSLKKVPKCFRCGDPKHCLNDCIAILCDCCQKVDHKTSDCPLILAPKPAMIVHGVAHEELTWWEFPLTGACKPRLENTRIGRVTISNGSMTIPQLITQLQWIVPDDQYQWDVRLVEENVYRVNFPSKLDLVRAQHFGSYTDPQTKISMKFDFWKRDIQPCWEAENIWVRVHDLPSVALDDFLGLWALGELFGKTLDVDMAFTRNHDILRIYITCLDPTLISNKMDIHIKGEFFKLRFEVEGMPPPVDQTEVIMKDSNNTDDDANEDHEANDGSLEPRGRGLVHNPVSNVELNKSNNTTDVKGAQHRMRFGTYDPNDDRTPLKKSWAKMVEEEECYLSAPASGPSLNPGRIVPVAAAGDFVEKRPAADLGSACLSPLQAVSSPRREVTAASPCCSPRGISSRPASPPVMRPVPPPPPVLKPISPRTASPPVLRPASSSTWPVAAKTGSPRADTMHRAAAKQPIFSALAVPSVSASLQSSNNAPMEVCSPGMDATSVGPAPSVPACVSPTAIAASTVYAATGPAGSPLTDKALSGGVGPVVMTSPTPIVRTTSPVHGMSPSYAPNETVSLLADDYGDMFSMDKLIEFGGISDFRTSGLRSSGRIRAQANADATQMERAMMIAQRRDEFLAQGKGLTPKFSILNLSDSEILARAEKLGVSLGSDENSNMASVKQIKEIELNRTLTMLEKINTVVEQENDPHNMLVSKMSELCEDIMPDEVSSDVVHPVVRGIESKQTQKRTRKNYNGTAVRRSTRVKTKKTFI
jgi:hypothetical protein